MPARERRSCAITFDAWRQIKRGQKGAVEVDERLQAEFDALADAVTTLSPNNLQDWLEIQRELDRIADAGFEVPVDEAIEHLTARGLEQDDVGEMRRRLRRTFGW